MTNAFSVYKNLSIESIFLVYDRRRVVYGYTSNIKYVSVISKAKVCIPIIAFLIKKAILRGLVCEEIIGKYTLRKLS